MAADAGSFIVWSESDADKITFQSHLTFQSFIRRMNGITQMEKVLSEHM